MPRTRKAVVPEQEHEPDFVEVGTELERGAPHALAGLGALIASFFGWGNQMPDATKRSGEENGV